MLLTLLGLDGMGLHGCDDVHCKTIIKLSYSQYHTKVTKPTRTMHLLQTSHG